MLFVILAVIIYYVIPAKYQWGWLLTVSYIYYVSNTGWAFIFIVTTTVTTWYAGLLLEKEESERDNVSRLYACGRKRNFPFSG